MILQHPIFRNRGLALVILLRTRVEYLVGCLLGEGDRGLMDRLSKATQVWITFKVTEGPKLEVVYKVEVGQLRKAW